MKRIAILTQPLKSNYGGILQNFALQKFFEEMDFQVVTINRVAKISNVIKFLSLTKRVILKPFNNNKIKVWTNDKENRIIYGNLNNFIKKNINISQDIFSNKELRYFFDNNLFDICIVGSDQVWRPIYSPYLPNYFLDFLENNSYIKKIAYAASFGTNKWELNVKETTMAKELVKKFDSISVREKSGINLLKENLNVNAINVLDPTLIIEKKYYFNLITHLNKNKTNNNLFIYILDWKDWKKDIVEKISKEKKLIPFEIMPQKKYHELESVKDIKSCVYEPIENWLQAFNNADYVITDSYHGTIFSIIFEKPFYTIFNNERGGDRFHSLLKILNLENRIINEDGNYEFSEINWQEVNYNLKKEKVKSISFLKDNILD